MSSLYFTFDPPKSLPKAELDFAVRTAVESIQSKLASYRNEDAPCELPQIALLFDPGTLNISVDVNGQSIKLIDNVNTLGGVMPLGSGYFDAKLSSMPVILFLLALKLHFTHEELSNALYIAEDDDCVVEVTDDESLFKFLSLLDDLDLDDFDDIHIYRPLFEAFGILKVKRTFASMLEETDVPDDWI